MESEEDQILQSGRLENSMEQLVAEGVERTRAVPTGDELDLSAFPNVSFYYKLVAKVAGKLYSIYDGQVEYKIGQRMEQKAMPGHKGGYYVYSTVKEAIFADVPFHHGGHWHAPRTVLKCICWSDFVVYGNGKMAFSNLMPVGDLGLPLGYKASKSEIRKAIAENQKVHYQDKERAWDRGLIKRNNTSKEMYENNLFENYFSDSVVRQVQAQISGPRQHVSEEVQNGLHSAISDIEARYR